MLLEDLALIGNCQFSALVARSGDLAWCCLPRFDSEPIFAPLLDEEKGGRFRIHPESGAVGEIRYLENTNVAETVFHSEDGSFRILDFAPRFENFGRAFRPTKLFRIVEPLSGTPRIQVDCHPILGWSQESPGEDRGSHHVCYHGFPVDVRLTTDIPLSYLNNGAFALTGRRHLVFSWGNPVEEPLAPLCSRFLQETVDYWQGWVKSCSIPPLFQKEVIRSGLALKLHCFEDTGAIAAALTTSLPEFKGSGRTWDYRFCWLRDSFYSLGAFRLLGRFEEFEGFLQFLLNVASAAPDLELAPLYRIDGRTDLEETIHHAWKGYGGNGPVRTGNQAAEHKQHDVYGEMVLALAPLFLDERLQEERTPQTLELLFRLARKAASVAGTPDAGIWEYRDGWHPQTFSSLMCWAATDRAAKVARIHRPKAAEEFEAMAEKIRQEILAQAWDPAHNAFVSAYGGSELDAAMLQAVPLHFLPAGDRRIESTVEVLRRELERDGWMMRYLHSDDFGAPDTAFVICTFWLVDALARVGRKEEARKLLESVAGKLTPLGLLAEDYAPATGRMWGNFPQAYSHVGLIHAAFSASPGWSDLY